MMPFFIPNGSQEEAIRAFSQFSETGKRILISTAANGVGKTAMGVNIVGNIIFGPQSNWFGGPVFKSPWKFPKKIWYLSDSDSWQNKLQYEIPKWFPAGKYTFTKNGRKFNSHLEAQGWVIDGKTYDQDVRQFESDDVGIIVYEEPPPRDIRKACVSRLRMGGYEIFLMTPLQHSAWIFDEIVNNKDLAKYLEVHYADVESNCIEHGIRGRLRHEDIVFMMDQWDEDEKQARAEGKPSHMKGLVYKGLHPDQHRHERPPNDFPMSEHDIYCVMDIHDRRPPAIVWFAVSVNGKKYAVQEYPNDPHNLYHTIKSSSVTFDDISKIIRTTERLNGWDSNQVKRYLDPNYGVRRMGDMGITIQQYFAMPEHGGLYFITNINDHQETGHQMVRNLLAVDKDGLPNLLIGDGLCNSWHQMQRYGRKEHASKREAVDGMSEKVGEKYKDFPDCFRYFSVVVQPCVRYGRRPAEAPPVQPNETDRIRKPATAWEVDWRNPNSTITPIIR